jgi:hypothetical protein
MPGHEAHGLEVLLMDMMQTATQNPMAPHSEQLVMRNLDQLEVLGRYSVIYEIARIDTMLNHIFVSDLSARLALESR